MLYQRNEIDKEIKLNAFHIKLILYTAIISLKTTASQVVSP